MKRFLSLLLCVLLLCLTACGSVPGTPAGNIPSASLPRLTDWESANEASFSWNLFYHMASTVESVTLTRQHADGSTSHATLTYENNRYTITDDAGSRSYTCLYYWSVSGSAESDCDLAEYFLLSNDLAISPEHIIENPGVIGEVAYAKYKTFDRAVSHGSVPEGFQSLLTQGLFGNRAVYGQTGLFVESAIPISSSQIPIVTIMHWSYDGKPGCNVDIHHYRRSILELEDSGFLIASRDYSDSAVQLLCYDVNGNLCWEYTLPYAGKQMNVDLLIQREDHIYLFGEISLNDDSDIYVGCFSLDGELLREQVFAGSDFEYLSRVAFTDEGFRLSGWTQSGDGPFPLSKDGHSVDFTADISLELVLSNVRKAEVNYASYMGMHNGQTVYSDDPIFTPGEQDQLPEDVSPIGIFDYADGYVIVRAHRLAPYQFQNPVMSYWPSYVEPIVTYYDAAGHPVWQGVGSIYVG